MKGNTILNDDPVYVSNDYFLKQKRSWIESENILLSIMGSVGEIAITPVDFQVCMANRAISIIKKIKENPYYIFVFLITIYGINQIERLQAGGVQERINLDDLRKIRIPKLSDSFVLKIQELALKRFKLIEKSKSLYTEAENLLLSELGLEDWKPQHKLSFVKNFSDTVEAERIDSEYFQPKYEELLRKIKEYKNGFNTLKKIVMLKDKNFNPENKEIYKYIELTNISDNGEIIGYTESLGQDLPTRARRKVQSDDVIVSSIEGSLESVALINDKLDNALCSTGFYINRSKEINSETLLCFVRTIAGQLQLKKGCSGTILTAINKPEYEDILIPSIKKYSNRPDLKIYLHTDDIISVEVADPQHTIEGKKDFKNRPVGTIFTSLPRVNSQSSNEPLATSFSQVQSFHEGEISNAV